MQFKHTTAGHLKGRVMWAVINDDGSTADHGTLALVAPSNNLVLDQGLDLIGTNELADCFKYCAVGTGSSTPAATQVELDNEHARTNNYDSDLCESTSSIAGSDPFVVTMKRGWNFPKGSLDSSVDGNYAELGFSPSATAGQNLFSRTLIKDESGNTITVAVASDQILRVAYELDVTLGPASPVASTVDITNIGTLNYKMQIEIISLQYSPLISWVAGDGSTERVNDSKGSMMEPSLGIAGNMALATSSTSGTRPFNGPQFSVDFNYDTNSLYGWDVQYSGIGTFSNVSLGVWEAKFTLATDQGNLANIKHIGLNNFNSNTDESNIRIQFDDGSEFTKENTHELTLTFQVTYTAN